MARKGLSINMGNSFKKIKGIRDLKKYNLPTPKTIFIFSFKKQEKEIDDFLKDKDFVMIRSDKKDNPDFCPHNLKCPKSAAKEFIRELTMAGYAAILQEHVPWLGNIVSGNILLLRKYILIEMMNKGPLIWLNRDGQVEEHIKINRNNLEEVYHFGKRLVREQELVKTLKMVKNLPPYYLAEFTLRPEGPYFWQIRPDKSAHRLVISFNGFKKIKGIKRAKRYNLPTPNVVFILDFRKQEKEIDDFLKGKDYVSIRSDRRDGLDFSPHNLRCPRQEAKKLIKSLLLRDYAVILQEHIPWKRGEISGNVLTLKKDILIEVMKGGPLIVLNRDGQVEEHIRLKKDNLKEIEHLGKRLIRKRMLHNLAKMVRHLRPYEIMEFSSYPNRLYCWQLRRDKSARKLEK